MITGQALVEMIVSISYPKRTMLTLHGRRLRMISIVVDVIICNL